MVVIDLSIATDQLIAIIAARNCPKVEVPPSLIFRWLLNASQESYSFNLRYNSRTFSPQPVPPDSFSSVALLMSFVLKADPEGSVTVSEIEYAGHSEKIPYEMQGSTAF